MSFLRGAVVIALALALQETFPTAKTIKKHETPDTERVKVSWQRYISAADISDIEGVESAAADGSVFVAFTY